MCEGRTSLIQKVGPPGGPNFLGSWNVPAWGMAYVKNFSSTASGNNMLNNQDTQLCLPASFMAQNLQEISRPKLVWIEHIASYIVVAKSGLFHWLKWGV